VKVYVFTFPGVWLGGVCVIVSWSIEDATERFRQHMREHAPTVEIRHDTVKVEEKPIDGALVAHFWDGDY
jgi:hypothetical protein